MTRPPWPTIKEWLDKKGADADFLSPPESRQHFDVWQRTRRPTERGMTGTVAHLAQAVHTQLQGRVGEINALLRGGFMDPREATARIEELTGISATLERVIRAEIAHRRAQTPRERRSQRAQGSGPPAGPAPAHGPPEASGDGTGQGGGPIP